MNALFNPTSPLAPVATTIAPGLFFSMWARARISGSTVLGLDGGYLAPPARRRSLHAFQKPFPRGRNVNQDPVADSRVRQAVRLIHPTSNGARMATGVSGKRSRSMKSSRKFV
jgi:hypothetical protein